MLLLLAIGNDPLGAWFTLKSGQLGSKRYSKAGARGSRGKYGWGSTRLFSRKIERWTLDIIMSRHYGVLRSSLGRALKIDPAKFRRGNRDRRAQKKLSQEASRALRGFIPMWWGAWSGATYNPTVMILVAIAVKLNVSLHELFAGAERR